MWMDNRIIHAATVSSRDTTLDTLTIDAAIPSGRTVPVDTLVKVQLGSDIIMADQYGSIDAAESEGWGYQGVVEADHPGLVRNMLVRAEIDFVTAGDERILKVIDDIKVVEED
jgi:hypothetical protein